MEEKILKNLQNTIILKINKKNKILKSYTDIFQIEPNTFLKDIFSPNQVHIILGLKDDEKTIINFKHNICEAFVKIIDKSKYLYLHDITDSHTMELKLKKSLHDLISRKEELQAVFDLAANGISILDKDGKFLYANKFLQTKMGYTMEELREESCISLSSQQYENPSKTAIKKAIQYGGVEKFRKVCVTKAGVPINVSMSLSYIKSTNEILMITSDITKDIQYQEKLRKQVEKELIKRDEQNKVMCHQSRLAAMGEMINSIAHQWRQPLNALGLIIQGLRHINNEQKVDTQLLREIEIEIMEKISFMSETIDDFSSFFKKSKEKEGFDALENINIAIRLIEAQLKAYGIKITINDQKLIDKNIFGFSNEFRQVILNLINNAMDSIILAKQQNGQIDIILRNEENDLIIQVCDNGNGIKKENIDKIFDPYFTTKREGSGIGLYMSKLIIEHHMGGLFFVENNSTGACFNIKITQKRM